MRARDEGARLGREMRARDTCERKKNARFEIDSQKRSLKALEKLNQNIRLKYAFGGNITFDKFEKKGESCLTKDVARVMFYVTGPNKKVGLCLCESIMDEDKLEWIINRVYLDFWANPNQPPIYMQIYPEKLIIEADAPTARDAFVRSQIIQAPEPKFVDNSDAEAVRRQKLLEAVMRGESAVPSRSRNDKPEIQAERSQAEKNPFERPKSQ